MPASAGPLICPPTPATQLSRSTFLLGPLLYLEAKDFSSLLADWNSSSQKRQWIKSGNYDVFSRSRLFLRLDGARSQFAAAAGLPPDMDFLTQVAGTRSALALYDIGNLQFLYITYLPSAKAMQTTLWQTRAKFEPRSAGGVDFYVRRDPESQKEVAFAIAGDYLLLATHEDLLAGALQLISGSQNLTVESEPWWSQSVAAAAAPGDLRMVSQPREDRPQPVLPHLLGATKHHRPVSILRRGVRSLPLRKSIPRRARVDPKDSRSRIVP